MITKPLWGSKSTSASFVNTGLTNLTSSSISLLVGTVLTKSGRTTKSVTMAMSEGGRMYIESLTERTDFPEMSVFYFLKM